jgi:hypothetical protein
MGIFDFFKKTFAEEKEDSGKVRFNDLEDWINTKLNKTKENSKYELDELRAHVKEEKNNLIKNVDSLENSTLKNKNIPDRMVHIMEGNRKIFIQKIRDLIKEIEVPEDFDKLVAFTESFDNTMDIFSKSVIKSHNIMSEFFVKETGAVSVNVKKIDELVKKMRHTIEDSGFEKYDEIMKSVKETKSEIERKNKLHGEIDLKEIELSEKEKKFNEREEKIKDLESSGEYSDFLDSTEEKRVLEEDLKTLESDVTHLFSEIEAGLKRYSNLNKSDKLVQSYLENPVSALVDDKELRILGLSEKIKEYILEGSIELKDKRKDKILERLEKFDKKHLQAFLNRREEMLLRLEKLKKEISGAGISSKMERARSDLSAVGEEINSQKKEIERLNKEFEEVNVDMLKMILETKIKDNSGEIVKIV